MFNSLPHDVVYYLSKYLHCNDWNSILRTSRETNEKFKTILLHTNYKKIRCLFFKNIDGKTVVLRNISLKCPVWYLEMKYIKKVDPWWSGEKGEINLFKFYRFTYTTCQLENNKTLESYGISNYSTIHVCGTFGHKAHPLEQNFNSFLGFDIFTINSL